jgi:hypothetical protein
VACNQPVQLLLPLESPSPRQRRKAEEGVPLRGPGLVDWREARHLADRARGLLQRGATVDAVHAETGIRRNTLHMMLTRQRRQH